MANKIRVLIVEDSLTVRRFLAGMISDAPDMVVVGEAHDGEEAIALARRLKPDIISMDVQMPHLDGLAATRRLMQQNPIPIVIVSARLQKRKNSQMVDLAFLALQSGALAVLETPPHQGHPDFEASRAEFLQTLRTMAGVSVVRRWGKTAPLPADLLAEPPTKSNHPLVITVGASAGGPVALHKILGALPKEFPVPIAIVQHMADGFIEGLVRWLASCVDLHVVEAKDGQIIKPGQAAIAGSGTHMLLKASGRNVRIVLDPVRGCEPYMPSVDRLFASTADAFGMRALGVLLTGMGEDGAQGLLKMRQRGARTIAQDEQSCLVYGMPGVAVEMGAAEQIVPLHHIAPTLQDMVKPARLV